MPTGKRSDADKLKRLAELGADTLATALFTLAESDRAASTLVDRLLASPEENAKSFKKQLSSLKRRSRFVSRGESGAYARELAAMLKGLAASGCEPKAGVESLAAFYEVDRYVFEQCDDSNGSIGDVFRFDAADLFTEYASRCDDKEWLVNLVIKLNQKNDYGVRDVLFERMARYVSAPTMQAAVDKLWKLARSEKGEYECKRWHYAIEDLARQLKNPALLEQSLTARSEGKLSDASIIEIAKLHFESGDPSTALEWIERVPLHTSFMAHERDELLIAIYKALHKNEKLAETAWRVFRRHRCPESLETLLSAIGADQNDAVIAQESKSILGNSEFDSSDAGFLIAVGRINEAERYIIDKRKKLNGDFYGELLKLVKEMLDHERPVAASVIFRALLDSILARAQSKYYNHGVKYLKQLDSLAGKITDWSGVESHIEYKTALLDKHKLKSSFWSRYQG